MPSFVTYPFSGSMYWNPRDFAWAPISGNKVALMWRNKDTASDRIMMQMVNFSASSAPGFGPVCNVVNTSATPGSAGYPSWFRLVNAGNNQLVAVIPAAFGSATSGASQFAVHLITFD